MFDTKQIKKTAKWCLVAFIVTVGALMVAYYCK